MLSSSIGCGRNTQRKSVLFSRFDAASLFVIIKTKTIGDIILVRPKQNKNIIYTFRKRAQSIEIIIITTTPVKQ